MLGANSLIQAAIPRVLTPEEGSSDAASLKDFHDHYMSVLRSNANHCAELAKSCDLLTVSIPKGAMYAMIGIKFELLSGFESDTDFAQKLLQEENIVMLPGQCFGMKNFIRIVTCPPPEKLEEAFTRIVSFCNRYRK